LIGIDTDFMLILLTNPYSQEVITFSLIILELR